VSVLARHLALFGAAGPRPKLALFRTTGSTAGTGSLADPCPLLSARQLALFCRYRLACLICHNAFSIKYLPPGVALDGLALFCTLWLSDAGMYDPVGSCPLVTARAKLALFGAATLPLLSPLRRQGSRKAAALYSHLGELALFRTTDSTAGTGSLADPCPLLSARQLASFRTILHHGDAEGTEAGNRSSYVSELTIVSVSFG
jgi:hypothetical protein